MKHRNRKVYREMEDWIDKASRLMIDAADQLERQELELKVLRRENDKMQLLLENYRQMQYDDQERIAELLSESRDLQSELDDIYEERALQAQGDVENGIYPRDVQAEYRSY